METNYWVPNRDVIKNFSINTGTTSEPEFTPICSMIENSLNIDLEDQSWYDYCSALNHHLITGADVSFDATVKLDINNKAVQNLIAKITTLLTEGEIAQFNNQTIQFELLTGVKEKEGVLEYTKFQAPAVLNFSELGGPAEDSAEFGLTTNINGKATVVA